MPDDVTVCPLQNTKHAQLLLDYCSRRLSSSASQALEAHLEVCPACQKFRDEQQAMWQALDTWEHADFSPGFDLRLQEKLEAEQHRSAAAKIGDRLTDWFDGISLKPALPLAGVFFVWMVGWQVWKPAQSPVPPDPEAAIEQVEADRRPVVQQEFYELQALPQEEQQQRLDSEDSQRRFSDQERSVLKSLLKKLSER